MRRGVISLTVAALVAAGGTFATSGSAAPAAAPWSGLRAGVGVADATWHVGAGAGQYADKGVPDPTEPTELPDWRPDRDAEWDPHHHATTQTPSYGVASRLSIRAIVLQSPGGQPVALVKNDNYLAQDMLTRRVAQLLAQADSLVTFDNILVSATHNHSSPYYSTPAAGVWVFQDAMDLRMFEYSARQTAAAILSAERSMRPARMGATTVQFRDFKANIAGRGLNEDGSPVGYPIDEGDNGLVVMRFDDMTNPSAPKPLATWVNYGQHPESLDSYNLISADFLAPFQRYVDRGTGVPVVFSQGDVGSAEGPYEHNYPRGQAPLVNDGAEPVSKIWAHAGFAQAERGAHLLAAQVLRAWDAIGGASNGVAVQVPYSTNPPVKMITHFIAGPVSHPYPAVGNCRSGPTEAGDIGAPALGFPDCARSDDEIGVTLPLRPQLAERLENAGVPIPDNYDLPSAGIVEENLRLKLQAVRIGDVLLASCACEAQSDLIKALETRTDKAQNNKWNGFDYANQAMVDAAWPGRNVAACHPVGDGSTYDCPHPGDSNGGTRITVPRDAFRHMQAQINNPSDGWDAPAYAAQANDEPSALADIKGNFTGQELSSQCGYPLSVGVGHSGDYNGYTVSYREYMARDSYRKALTSYGPHTADYMVTRLMSVAANLRCGTPIPSEPTDALAAADEARQRASSAALGRIAAADYAAWTAQIPDSAGPARIVTQPSSIQRFDAATATWVGGDNWTDNPTVVVQRLVNGTWQPFADQSGEVVVVLQQQQPALGETVANRRGLQTWKWMASFEAFDAYPRADVPGGQTPAGTYRFVMDGNIHRDRAVRAYHLTSAPFTVSPWTGVTARDLRTEPGGAVSFVTDPVAYPRTYDSPIKFIRDDGGGLPGNSVVCETCTFRPWAAQGTVTSATVSVLNASGDVVRTVAATQSGGRWVAATALQPGESAVIRPGGLRDAYGETNGAAIPVG